MTVEVIYGPDCGLSSYLVTRRAAPEARPLRWHSVRGRALREAGLSTSFLPRPGFASYPPQRDLWRIARLPRWEPLRPYRAVPFRPHGIPFYGADAGEPTSVALVPRA